MPLTRPGYNPTRLARLVHDAVAALSLDLSGLTILTEAATGPFAVTAALAACAGAREVFCVARDSRYGSAEDAFAATRQLAAAAGITRNLAFFAEKDPAFVAQADVITNSRHLRPLDQEMIDWMHDLAVISLMYEGWEHRREDVDRAACQARGLPLVGTNERDPRIGVFDYLGPAAVHLLTDAGFEVLGSRLLLVCDNPFRPYLERYLKLAGATVASVSDVTGDLPEGPVDALLLAVKPTGANVIDGVAARRLGAAYPGCCVVQFWGDIDRGALAGESLFAWPHLSPGPGRMGILLSDLGPTPAVMLQAGGLKVGEILARTRQANPIAAGCQAAVQAALRSGFGSPLSGQELEDL